MIDWFQIAAVAAAFVLAGLVKGVIGMGLPTVAMGLLGLAMPPAQAAALLLIPSFVTNVWQF
ncbi:MAG TPA: sulfite exporter TauE/SafE family protein, partial [Xanthobacteraceae bacterium]